MSQLPTILVTIAGTILCSCHRCWHSPTSTSQARAAPLRMNSARLPEVLDQHDVPFHAVQLRIEQPSPVRRDIHGAKKSRAFGTREYNFPASRSEAEELDRMTRGWTFNEVNPVVCPQNQRVSLMRGPKTPIAPHRKPAFHPHHRQEPPRHRKAACRSRSRDACRLETRTPRGRRCA